MIELAAIDRFANQVSVAQRNFVLALEGLYGRFKVVELANVNKFKREALAIMRAHLDSVESFSTNSLRVISFLAGDADASEPYSENLMALIEAQSRQSVALFSNTLRRIHFDRRLGLSAVSRGVLIKQRDRLGRKGKPERFAYLSARKVALDAFNDLKMHDNMREGIVSRVLSENARNKYHGVEIALSPSNEQISYEFARANVFHPQARAIVD